MVGNFFRKILGSDDDQRDAEFGDREVRPASEDSYGDPADQSS